MAIRGLTPQLAERGKIKIGEKGEMKTSGQGKEFAQPKKLDHFVITTVQRDAAMRLIEDKVLMAKIKEAQGNPPKLTEIPVRLLYDNIDLNFLTRYSAYSGTRCWCSGDGEWAARFEEGEIPDAATPGKSRKAGKGEYGQRTCPCEHLEATYTGSPKCKPFGTLQVLLEGVDRVGGVWKFRTTSWNTVNAILSSLALIKTLTGGPLAGIPLVMVLSPKTVTVPTTGKNMVVYVVSLEYRGPEECLAKLGYDIAKRRIEHQVKMENIEAEARRLLVAPHQEAPLEQKEVAEEFYPEGVMAPEGQGDKKPPSATVQDATGKKDPPPPTTTTDPEPEPTTAFSSETQGGDLEGNHTAPRQDLRTALTFPQLMEACKAKQYIEFPLPLMTSKGVELGEFVDRTVSGDVQTLFLELREDMPQVADGLTKEKIAQFFNEAGIKVEFRPPGWFKDGPGKKEEVGEGNGGGHSELAARAAQAQAAATESKKKAPAKALF